MTKTRREEVAEKICAECRLSIGDEAERVKDLMNLSVFSEEDESFPGQHGEAKANVMLAVRHLEDARMRIGKVMQQFRGGVSILDPHDKKLAEGPDNDSEGP